MRLLNDTLALTGHVSVCCWTSNKDVTLINVSPMHRRFKITLPLNLYTH